MKTVAKFGRVERQGLLRTVALLPAFFLLSAGLAFGATRIPALWTAGGLSAGNDSAGQSARMAVDPVGNIAIVSGPANARELAVTSYTGNGTLRWRRTIVPSSGVFVGDWVAAALNGDFIAVGHNRDSHGRPIQSTMVRYATDGTLLWRIDFSSGFFPVVGKLVVDSPGNAYLTWNAVGSGLFVQKYSPSGALLWSRGSSNGGAYAIATSLALSPDETDVIATGDISGGATWITAAFDTATGVPRWEVAAPEGIANLDVVVDSARVYVTGQGNIGTSGFMTVIAYDRATGTRLWRSDVNPPTCCAYGTRIALAPDGSLSVAGRASSGGYFDWWIVSLNTNGNVRWQARRDAAISGDEVPAAVFVLDDGTTVVSGTGGPVIRDILGNAYMQGVTAGYGPDGTLLWEAFSRLPTVWASPLPNGDVCATGGYDALISCFRVSGGVRAVMTATPSTGTAPLSVAFDGSGSTSPNGNLVSWEWSFGDGSTGTGQMTVHEYSDPGNYAASLTVTDNTGATSTATGTIVVTPPPPAAPSDLTVALSGNLVMLGWRDNSSNETLFYIERCEGPGCLKFANFATQAANITSYVDYSAISGQSYSYRVWAYNPGGYSSYSNIASIGPQSLPAAPSQLIAMPTSTNSIGLQWTNGTVVQTDVKIERCKGVTCRTLSKWRSRREPRRPLRTLDLPRQLLTGIGFVQAIWSETRRIQTRPGRRPSKGDRFPASLIILYFGFGSRKQSKIRNHNSQISCGVVVHLVRKPTRHVGGRGFESRRPRH